MLDHDLDAFTRERLAIFYPKADLPIADEVLRGLGASTPCDPRYLEAARVACRDLSGREPLDISPLGQPGTFHVLFRAHLRDGHRVIVRLHVLSSDRVDYPMVLDAWASEQLLSIGLPSVTVHALDLTRTRYPYDVQIVDEAKGISLKSYDNEDVRLTPLLHALGRHVARLHELQTPGFGFLDVRPLVKGESPDRVRGIHSRWRSYILRRLEAHVERCASIGVLSCTEARQVFSVFASADDLLDGVEPTLLHGDLGSHNIFCDEGRISALIDWEDALAGDPIFEVAFWATFHPERRHAAFFEGYQSVRPLGADFEERFWLYYLRIALSKTVLRHRLGLSDLPGRSPASHRIQKGLERFETVRKPRQFRAA